MQHPATSNARSDAEPRFRSLRALRALGMSAALLSLASCGGEDAPPPSEAGYILLTDAVELDQFAAMIGPVRGSTGTYNEAFLIPAPFGPGTDYVPDACVGSSTTTFSGNDVQVDWHCTTSPYRVVGTLSYIGSGSYGGIALVNVVTDADDGSVGVYVTLTDASAPCTTASPQNCVPDLPYGDGQQLPKDLYALSSTAPELSLTTPLTMRYEDQWVPLRCDGTTSYHSNLSIGKGILLNWQCVYLLPDGTAVGSASDPAFWNGTLVDPDGDGTYEGNLLVDPLQSDGTIGDTIIVPFTITPETN